MTRAPAGGGFGRWAARILAVIAVAAAAIAIFVIVSGSLDSSGGDDKPAKKEQKADSGGPEDTPETYVVQTGDSLGSISAKVGVPVAKLEQLNPDIDPVVIQAGMTLKLR